MRNRTGGKGVDAARSNRIPLTLSMRRSQPQVEQRADNAAGQLQRRACVHSIHVLAPASQQAASAAGHKAPQPGPRPPRSGQGGLSHDNLHTRLYRFGRICLQHRALRSSASALGQRRHGACRAPACLLAGPAAQLGSRLGSCLRWHTTMVAACWVAGLAAWPFLCAECDCLRIPRYSPPDRSGGGPRSQRSVARKPRTAKQRRKQTRFKHSTTRCPSPASHPQTQTTMATMRAAQPMRAAAPKVHTPGRPPVAARRE